MEQYKIGLVSVSFRDREPQEILEAMAKADLSCIEWGSDVHAPANDTAQLQKIAALQDKFGIVCSSYGTYFRLGETPISQLEDYIRAAKILGTDILRLWCGTKSGADMTGEERTAFLTECRLAADVAKAHDVMLCMECHRKTMTERIEDAVWLMRKVDSPHFRMYWQPFQWVDAAENMENAKQIAPFATHIHVFNWKDKLRFPLRHAIDAWREYLKPFSTPRTLLLEFMPDDKLDTLPDEVDALREIIGGLL